MSIRLKITGAFLSLLVVISVFAYRSLHPQTKELRESLFTLAKVTAGFVAENLDAAVEFQDAELIRAAIEQAMELRDCRYVAVSNASGKVLAESGNPPPELDRLPMKGQATELLERHVVVRQAIASGMHPIGHVLLAMSLDRVFIESKRQMHMLWVEVLAIGLVALLVTFVLTRYVVRPITEISRGVKRVTDGDLDCDVAVSTRDEIGRLAADINQMIEGLRKYSQENALERWTKTGAAELQEAMRGEQDIAALARRVVSYLAKYLNAPVGALYVAKQDGSLQLAGSHAYTQRKHLSNRYQPGEGLVGQAALEKERIVVSEVPDDYVVVRSGLGQSPPRHLVVTPLLHNEAVKGVLELAAFEPFSEAQLELLSSVSESVAIALGSAQARQQMQELLDETQRQAGELQGQQHNLEAANETLEEQTKALKESEDSLKVQSEELQAANQELEEKTDSLERQRAAMAKQNAELEAAKTVTEQKARELELANTYKSEFLANMSHELRTPLNSLLILSRSRADNEHGNLSEEQVKAAEIIHHGGEDLLSLINDILDLSKVEAGMLEVDVQPTEIAGILHGLKDQFEAHAQVKGLKFLIEHADDLPGFISTDIHRVRQVLKNLLSNALKFTEQGSVTLTVHAPAKDTVLRNPKLRSVGAVGFSVRDTGPGIPRDRQESIFDAFCQADGSTSRQYGGTGLGLSISRQLALLLGGEMQLQSELGKGSTFTLYLPAGGSLPPGRKSMPVGHAMSVSASARGAPSSTGASTAASRRNGSSPASSVAAPAKESARHKGNSKRPSARGEAAARATPAPVSALSTCGAGFVKDDRNRIARGDKVALVVEDDPSFAQALVELTRSRGYRCVAAPDGASALQLALGMRPTVILLDLGLPDIPGARVLDQLKYDPRPRHIPVHVLSGRDAGDLARSHGAVGFLRKPASADAIRAALGSIEEYLSEDARHVLVIESQDHGGRSLVPLLENRQTEVQLASTAGQALGMCAARRCHCIVVNTSDPRQTARALLDEHARGHLDPLPPVIVHSSSPLPPALARRLRRRVRAVVKQAPTKERVLEQTTLFLHSVDASLTSEQQQIIRMLHDPDEMLQGRQLLLVDDDMRNTFALSRVLRQHGLHVLMADNGRMALEKLAHENDIELVLMDIMMPVMDGFEAMRRIRAQERFAELPIIALTAKAMLEDRAKCLDAGANDYMTKPVDIDRLLSLLRIWLFKAS
ncbi:MAG: response regulator [Proteobacteria bacterium]|nr:response regulator [Pseudomonadota bacterium]